MESKALTWQVERVCVLASVHDMERVVASPEQRATLHTEAYQHVVFETQEMLGTLYVGKRYKSSEAFEEVKVPYEGVVQGYICKPTTTYGYQSVYFKAMAVGLGLALGFWGGTVPAFIFGWLVVGLVGFGLPSDSTKLVFALLPYSGALTVPTTYVENWYIDPTIQGNVTFDGMPLANSYTRVVFDDGYTHEDLLERFDAYTAAAAQEY
jgi:hypothetical protein